MDSQYPHHQPGQANGNNSAPIPSKARPIHTVREIRETPDETEPTFSYEQESFMANTDEWAVEDEFHRRMNSSRRNSHNKSSSSLGSAATPVPVLAPAVIPPSLKAQKSAGSSSGGIGGVMASFWRTNSREVNDKKASKPAANSSSSSSIRSRSGKNIVGRSKSTPDRNNGTSNGSKHIISKTAKHQQQQVHRPTLSRVSSASSQQKQQQQQQHYPVSTSRIIAKTASSSSTVPPTSFSTMKRLDANERKVSGGLLGAALQLQSQSPLMINSSSSSIGNASIPIHNNINGNNMMAYNRSGITPAALAGRNLTNSSSTTSSSNNNNNNSSSNLGGSNMYIPEHSLPHTDRFRRAGSSMSSQERNKKDVTKQRQQARRQKMEALTMDELSTDGNESFRSANVTSERSVTSTTIPSTPTLDLDVPGSTASQVVAAYKTSISLGTPSNSSRSIGSTGGVLFGKSSSLIFPTGVAADGSVTNVGNVGAGVVGIGETLHHNKIANSSATSSSTLQTLLTTSTAEAVSKKQRKLNVLIDQCESVRFPFKKKLVLDKLGLVESDIPVKDLYHTNLGNTLHKLSLTGNRLVTLPAKLVTCLPVLKTLNVSQCDLRKLPEKWHLPQLKRLNLSNNQLTEFPEESMLEGLLELQELNMQENKVTAIIVPQNPKVLQKLEKLDMGFNDLDSLPDDLDRLKSLKVLKVMNNLLERIPMQACDMDLKSIEVAGNPLIEPPLETCERGICSMKRYYHCLRVEEQSKQKALEAVQHKAARTAKKGSMVSVSASSVGSHTSSKKSSSGPGVIDKLGMFAKPKRKVHRKTSEDSHNYPSLRDPSSMALNRQKSTSSRSEDSGRASHGTVGGGTNESKASSSGSSGHYSAPKVAPSINPILPGQQIYQQQQSPQLQQPPQQQYSQQQPQMIMSDVPPPPPPIAPSTPGTPSSLAATSQSSFSKTASPVTMISPTTIPGSTTVSTIQERAKVVDASSVASITSDDANPADSVTVNDTLKVIFVGMAMAGKTSMIKRLIEGEHAIVPKRDNRTIGVDIYEWDPKDDHRFSHIDTRIVLEDEKLKAAVGDVNVKLSVWDFAGQHVYHATHELFFSQRALYVLVWDMGATNRGTMRKKNTGRGDNGAFKLTYDSSDEEDEGSTDFVSEEEERRAQRALERDIDEKVQFWVDCIQSSAPGSAILPVASFDDIFTDNDGAEAKRRCSIMRDRLLRHEERRIQGIQNRLKEYEEQNRANETGAIRLRKLLCSYSRPKLIFGKNDDDSVVRVSGINYTGFATLTERIVHIATGRNKVNMRFPIFRGHVGARIPRMRLQVRDAVRNMRNRFKVAEWGYFINSLRDLGLTSVEDISDALHFLTNIGELSFFGSVMPDRMLSHDDREDTFSNSSLGRRSSRVITDEQAMSDDEFDDDDNDEDEAMLSMDDTAMTSRTTLEEGSLTSMGDANQGLSQFIFLNPRWLVTAVACILRHDLDQEIQEMRRWTNKPPPDLQRSQITFNEANLSCPIITSEDACMLWQSQKFTKKAAQRAEQYSNDMIMKPFEFLQLLLTRFGVFVPIDLGIEKAFLGGKEYARNINLGDEIVVDEQEQEGGKFFFLPSLLGPGEPAEAWTYKSSDSWKGTLCHTVLFPDGVPPGLMERITASVLNTIHTVANLNRNVEFQALDGTSFGGPDGQISVKEILCWRTAFFIKLGMEVSADDGVRRESIVEIYTGLVDRDSPLCVGSDSMNVGSRRLIVSGKGQIGDGGRKIWKGGYIYACKAVQRVMEQYGGLEYDKEAFCPECLAKKAVSEAGNWNTTVLKSAVRNSEGSMLCRHGHRIDTRLLAGPIDALHPQKTRAVPEGESQYHGDSSNPVVPINDLLPAVVVVGLWDGKSRKVVRVGSGFLADKKRGLIVTAAHTLMNIWGDKNTPFGENYYGLSQGHVVIGVIPRANEGEPAATRAVFRYFAKIVAKDPDIEQGQCHLDACVLQIKTRMENDVEGSGERCGDQIERLLLNNPYALKQEKLQQLKITEKCELDEQVRIVGYNQGGEGLLGPGETLNRDVDFARGYVCKKFSGGEGGQRHRFKPREEIVVICPTIGGHSGGPCVNQQGEVIGILSRADPAETQRCYLVPTHEWKGLLKRAKKNFGA